MIELTKEDWGNLKSNEDYCLAFDTLYGKTQDEAIELLLEKPFLISEFVYFTNVKPMLKLLDIFSVALEQHGSQYDDLYIVAARLIKVIDEKLETEEITTANLTEQTRKMYNYISQNQSVFDLDEDIYGDFSKNRILK